jgi:hypothetical protein
MGHYDKCQRRAPRVFSLARPWVERRVCIGASADRHGGFFRVERGGSSKTE